MINMNYSDWNSVCQSVFNIGNDLKYYLQWYPFYKLSKTNKEHISSENFFNNFIKNGTIFKEYNSFNFSLNYSQKTSGSFRSMKLVSPFLYLYLESIGYHISQEYRRKASHTICYYSGNLVEKDFFYKNSYDNFFVDVNVYSTEYDYFYKFDIANFFDSIDINLLFELINEKKEILDTRSSLIYKRLLQLIGDNKFPTIENSPTLSYLATYIYI